MKKMKKKNNLFDLKPVRLKARKSKMTNLIFGYDRPKPARKVKGKLAMSWQQTKKRYPNMSPMGDADRDGVKNFLDCKPFDKKRQKVFTKKEKKEIESINWKKKQIGEKLGSGAFGAVFGVKDNPKYVIKKMHGLLNPNLLMSRKAERDQKHEYYNYKKFQRMNIIAPTHQTSQGLVRKKLKIIPFGFMKEKTPDLSRNQVQKIIGGVNQLSFHNIELGDKIQAGIDDKNDPYIFDQGTLRSGEEPQESTKDGNLGSIEYFMDRQNIQYKNLKELKLAQKTTLEKSARDFAAMGALDSKDLNKRNKNISKSPNVISNIDEAKRKLRIRKMRVKPEVLKVLNKKENPNIKLVKPYLPSSKKYIKQVDKILDKDWTRARGIESEVNVYQTAFDEGNINPDYDDPYTKKDIKELDQNPGMTRLIVDKDKGKVIGGVTGNVRKGPDGNVYIQKLFVNPSERKRGVGKEVVTQLIETHGAVRGGVANNPEAKGFWKRMTKKNKRFPAPTMGGIVFSEDEYSFLVEGKDVKEDYNEPDKSKLYEIPKWDPKSGKPRPLIFEEVSSPVKWKKKTTIPYVDYPESYSVTKKRVKMI